MIPLHWNQSMIEVSHSWRRYIILPLWILHIIKILHLMIIWVSCFFLLHPTLPCFVAFILMIYGWKVSFWWCHMKRMDILFLLLMMELLEHHLISIFIRILCYIMMIHIHMDAPMVFTWVTWRLMIFLAPYLVHLMLEELHPTLRWRYISLKNIIVGKNILCYFMMIYIFMGVLMRLIWDTWSLHVLFAPYLVHILVEVLHSLLGWKNKWLIIILMHITFFGSNIIGHGILTYVIGAYLIGHLKHVCTWKMVVYSLGGISTFMISWWGTSLMYILIMLLYNLMIYIIHSICLE